MPLTDGLPAVAEPSAILPDLPSDFWWVVDLGILVALAVVCSYVVVKLGHRFRNGKLLVSCIIGGVLFAVVGIPFLLYRAVNNETAYARLMTQDDLKQLALALNHYADDHEGRLPAAALYSTDGRPLLSWRVLVLPYLDENDLYRQFQLDEPWDGPHNLTLLSRMPKVFASPLQLGGSPAPSTTFFQVFVGLGAAFEEREGLRLPQDFPDGVATTILVAEAGEAVPWTKPLDLNYDPNGPLPPMGGIFRGTGFYAAMADASIKRFRPKVTQATIRDAITRKDGRLPGSDWP